MICCSLTGMLLEQHKDAVLNLLSDPKLLEEQVNFAMKTLKEYVPIYHLFLLLLRVPDHCSALKATCCFNLQYKGLKKERK